MNEKVIRIEPASAPALEPVILQAEPESLEIDWQKTAIVLIDMLNALISNGGMIDLVGVHDVSKRQEIIMPMKNIAGCLISEVVNHN